jgi:hypothetical protein
VIENDVFIEAEIIEQPRRRSLKAHHRRLSRKSAGFNESRRGSDDNQSPTFSTVSAQSGRPPQRLRRARLGPVVRGPDSKVLIEILDRLAAHLERLAYRARWCVYPNLHHYDVFVLMEGRNARHSWGKGLVYQPRKRAGLASRSMRPDGASYRQCDWRYLGRKRTDSTWGRTIRLRHDVNDI